jgi:hypothetical protein
MPPATSRHAHSGEEADPPGEEEEEEEEEEKEEEEAAEAVEEESAAETIAEPAAPGWSAAEEEPAASDEARSLPPRPPTRGSGDSSRWKAASLLCLTESGMRQAAVRLSPARSSTSTHPTTVVSSPSSGRASRPCMARVGWKGQPPRLCLTARSSGLPTFGS